jgi:hypothetical protein
MPPGTEITAESTGNNQMPVKKINRLKEFVRYSAAVAAGLSLVVVAVFALNFFSLSPEKIFSQHYPGFSLQDRPLKGETEIEAAFRQKDYKKLGKLSETKKIVSQKEKFLTAVAWIEQHNNSKAIHNLKEVISGNNTVPPPFVVAISEYFLALVYIRNEDYDLALELMEKIYNDPSHFYHERISRKMIRRVRMLKWR